MTLRTEDFPQADRLDNVAKVAEAVHNGKTADSEFEQYIGLDSGSRQGRYYRKAAELLGLIVTHDNHSSLTTIGREYVALANDADRRAFLAARLARTELFGTVARFIQDSKPTPEHLSRFIVALYPGARNTALRRVNSIVNYLKYSRLGTIKSGTYAAGPLVGAALVRRTTNADGLLGGKPKTPLPVEFTEPTGGTFTYAVDSAKLERANLTHQLLVAAKALFLQRMGLEAFENDSVDLFAQSKAGGPIMYEMKSVTDDNFRSQMRRAVSQLYEYRYFFNQPSARLCVVTNRKPGSVERPYVRYLEENRTIAYAWSEDFKAFGCTADSANLLDGFAP